MTVLEASSVRKSYPHAGTVVRDVSFAVSRGECVALVGPSGAGKSTLLHCLATLDQPDAGSVLLSTEGGTVDLAALSGVQLARVRAKHLGMIYQFHHLLPEFTALENVMVPALILGSSTREATDRARYLLQRVNLAKREQHYPTQLSGGEQQRVAIARALANTPSVLFADEPTGNLDSANASAIADLFFEVQAEFGLSCIIATHSAELATRCNRTLLMRDGAIVTA